MIIIIIVMMTLANTRLWVITSLRMMRRSASAYLLFHDLSVPSYLRLAFTSRIAVPSWRQLNKRVTCLRKKKWIPETQSSSYVFKKWNHCKGICETVSLFCALAWFASTSEAVLVPMCSNSIYFFTTKSQHYNTKIGSFEGWYSGTPHSNLKCIQTLRFVCHKTQPWDPARCRGRRHFRCPRRARRIRGQRGRGQRGRGHRGCGRGRRGSLSFIQCEVHLWVVQLCFSHVYRHINICIYICVYIYIYICVYIYVCVWVTSVVTVTFSWVASFEMKLWTHIIRVCTSSPIAPGHNQFRSHLKEWMVG